MTGKPDIPPRVLNKSQTAAYLGRSPKWLAEHMDELRASGFPAMLPYVEGYDKEALAEWLDRIGGRLPDSPQSHNAAWTAAADG